MIIDNFHIFGAGIGPPKTDPPLIIDADAVLARTLAAQRLKAIARRHSQIIESGRDFQWSQFAPRHSCDIDETSDANTPGQRLGVSALE